MTVCWAVCWWVQAVLVEVLPTLDYFPQSRRAQWIPLTQFLTDCDEEFFG